MLVLGALAEEDISDPWKDAEEQQGDTGTDIPFDPIAEMKKLWEQEMQEGKEFRDGLRESGVNVEEWEEKFDHWEIWDGEQSPHEVFRDTIGNDFKHEEL